MIFIHVWYIQFKKNYIIKNVCHITSTTTKTKQKNYFLSLFTFLPDGCLQCIKLIIYSKNNVYRKVLLTNIWYIFHYKKIIITKTKEKNGFDDDDIVYYCDTVKCLYDLISNSRINLHIDYKRKKKFAQMSTHKMFNYFFPIYKAHQNQKDNNKEKFHFKCH